MHLMRINLVVQPNFSLSIFHSTGSAQTEMSSSKMQYEGEKQPVIIQSVPAVSSALLLSVSPHRELPVTL